MPRSYLFWYCTDFFPTPWFLFFIPLSRHLQDISCPEAVKGNDINSAAVTSAFEKAKAAFSAAEAGSLAVAEAQIDMEVNKSMTAAVDVILLPKLGQLVSN